MPEPQTAMHCSPESLSEIGDIVRRARIHRHSIAPRGYGSRSDLGASGHTTDIILSTTRLTRVVDYTPEDLTITVEAGLTLNALQQVARAHGQWLPYDPPLSDTTTVGGMLAANASGPRRLLYGTLRDMVLGMRMVDGHGIQSHAGGKVVKNVTGYDLCKLYIGSLGTLGIIGEASFKLSPIPVLTRTVAAWFTHVETAQSVAVALVRSPLFPSAVELLSAEAAAALGADARSQTGVLLVVLYEGFGYGIARQVAETYDLFRRRAAVIVDDDIEALWHQLTVYRGHPDNASGNDLIIKVSAPLTTLPSIWQRVATGPLQAGLCLYAHAGSGVIQAHWPNCPAEAQVVVDEIAHLRRLTAAVRGSVIIERLPAHWGKLLDVWGDPPAGFAIMRRLKEAFDPDGLLNPGRFVGGL